MEGASLSLPAQVLQSGKEPMIHEGPVIDLEASSPSQEAKEIIQHLRAENDVLQRRLEGAQWTITYLE